MWLYYLMIIVHTLVCLLLIGVVLLQSGKAADLAGAFGGMGSQTAFGPRGSATVLSKATTIAAGLFMVTSMGLSIVATRNQGGAATVLDNAPKAIKKAPDTKAPAPGGASTTVPNVGVPAGAQSPTVTIGDKTVELPKPGQPGAVVIPEGATPQEAQKKVQEEMERVKKLAAEAAEKAGKKKQ